MNIRYRFLIALLLTTSLFLAEYFFSSLNNWQRSPMGFGTPDDPQSAAAYERMRLADPSTGMIPANIRKRELEFASRLPVNSSRSITWQPIGPKLLGGRTRAVGIDVRDENIVLAGGVTGGMWRSVNAGQNFTKTTGPDQIHSVTTVVQDKRAGKEDTWYMGTGEYYGIVSGTSFTSRFSGDGIFKSTDNGQSWTHLTSTSSGTPHTLFTNGDMDFVWEMVVDHTDLVNDVVLAAVYNGIFRSEDGGATWTPVLGFDSTTTNTSDYVDLMITPSGVFYAALSSDGPDKGVWRSDDGINWVSLYVGSGMPGTFDRVEMCYNPQNENELMIVMESMGTGTNGHSLFKYTYLSGDGSGAGGQWENRTANLPNGSCTGYFDFDFGYFQTQGGYDMFIAWHPADDSVLILGGTNLYRTTDQFTTPAYTWIGGYKCTPNDPADYVYPNHHPDQHGMIFLPSDPNKVISYTDGGLYRSEDILQDSVIWTSLNNGYVTSQFYTVALEEGNVSNDFLSAGAQDNGTWFTPRNHIDSVFRWVYRGDGSYCAIPNGRNFYIFSIQQGKIYKVLMNDNGDTLMSTRIDPIGGPNSYSFINPFIMDPYNSDRLYITASNVLWRNDSLSAIPNTGNIYDRISTGWTKLTTSQVSGALDGGISCIEISKDASDVVFYGTNKGKLFKLSGASGTAPVKTNIGGVNFPANAYMDCIAANPFDADEILVTFSNYGIPSIFYTNDGGLTWSDISGNLEENPDGSGAGPAVYWATIYPGATGNTYLVGTSVGLFSTNQINGSLTTWAQEGSSTIGNVVINMIKARTSDGKIAVATHGNGLYTGQLTPIMSALTPEKPGFSAKAYPNPFTDRIFIDFEVEKAADLSISIIDLRGNAVRRFASGHYREGLQRLVWEADTDSGSKVASGTYLIRISGKGVEKNLSVVVN